MNADHTGKQKRAYSSRGTRLHSCRLLASSKAFAATMAAKEKRATMPASATGRSWVAALVLACFKSSSADSAQRHPGQLQQAHGQEGCSASASGHGAGLSAGRAATIPGGSSPRITSQRQQRNSSHAHGHAAAHNSGHVPKVRLACGVAGGRRLGCTSEQKLALRSTGSGARRRSAAALCAGTPDTQ